MPQPCGQPVASARFTAERKSLDLKRALDEQSITVSAFNVVTVTC